MTRSGRNIKLPGTMHVMRCLTASRTVVLVCSLIRKLGKEWRGGNLGEGNLRRLRSGTYVQETETI